MHWLSLSQFLRRWLRNWVLVGVVKERPAENWGLESAGGPMGEEGKELGTESLARAAGLGLPRDLRLGLDCPRPWTEMSREGVETELTSGVGAGHRRRRPAVGRSTRATERRHHCQHSGQCAVRSSMGEPAAKCAAGPEGGEERMRASRTASVRDWRPWGPYLLDWLGEVLGPPKARASLYRAAWPTPAPMGGLEVLEVVDRLLRGGQHRRGRRWARHWQSIRPGSAETGPPAARRVVHSSAARHFVVVDAWTSSRATRGRSQLRALQMSGAWTDDPRDRSVVVWRDWGEMPSPVCDGGPP